MPCCDSWYEVCDEENNAFASAVILATFAALSCVRSSADRRVSSASARAVS